jgi:type IV pilus assembly protein PilE
MPRARLLSAAPSPAPRGFTLIEALAALAISAILASVALPSYVDSMRKGRRAEAVHALAAVQLAQERWRANRRAYADDLAALAPPTTRHYRLELSAVGPDGYTVVAAAVDGSPQALDGPCARLRLRVVGADAFQGAAAPGEAFDETNRHRCWSR